HHVTDLDVRHLRRHRHQIVRHGAVGELPTLVIDAMLQQRRADSLDDAAADLLVDELRVDDGAAVLYAPVLQQRDEAGVGVDFEVACLYAVGEGEREGARYIMARGHHLGLEAGRQRVGPEVDDARNLVEADTLAAGCGIDNHAVSDVERRRLRLQDRARGGQHIPAQRLAGLPGGFAADASGARGPGAATVGHVIGIAGDDAHARNRNPERRGNALRDHSLGALSLFGDAGRAEDRAGRIEANGGTVLRGDARAADAVEGGGRVRHFDE